MLNKMTSRREMNFTNRINMISRLREEICECDRELYGSDHSITEMFAIVRQKRAAQKKLQELKYSMR